MKKREQKRRSDLDIILPKAIESGEMREMVMSTHQFICK